VAAGPPERFSPETLFEIINGDAEVFLKAGFVSLETRRHLLNGDGQQWIDVFAYRMTGHRSAFSVYSVRRDRNAAPVPLTRFSYRFQDGLFFVHGPHYVDIRAADRTPAMVEATDRLAAAFISEHPVSQAPIAELSYFPDRDMIPGSAVLHASGAFGFKAFSEMFTAAYRLSSAEATAFFRRCPTPEAAVQTAADYYAFLSEYDGVPAPLATALTVGRLIRMGERYTLIFTRGRWVAGVQDAPGPGDAHALARRLDAGLAKIID
jgi:hypothetical protein